MLNPSLDTLVLDKRVTIDPRCKRYIAFEFPSKKPYIKLLTRPHILNELREICARASSRILILSPFVTRKALSYILSGVDDDVNIGIVVGTRSSYIEAKRLKDILGREVNVLLRGRIHCKIILTDNEVEIGSANITMSGLKRSYEISIATNDQCIVDNVSSFSNLVCHGAHYEEPYYGDLRIASPTSSAFVTSIKNLPPLVLELARYAKRSVTILTPTYNIEAMELLLNHIDPTVNIEAFVKLDERDWIKRGVSDPWAIRLLLERGATVWDTPLLHAKVFMVDNEIALISSLNITNKAFSYIFDAGILTKNSNLIAQLINFIDRLRKRQVKREVFEDRLARFNVMLPFIEIEMMQKEGDHFSDERDLSYSEEVESIKVASWEYPRHAGEDLSLPVSKVSLESIRREKGAKPADAIVEGEVLVGEKPLTSYVKACIFLFLNERIERVKIKARGKFISKAVDVARMFRYSTIKVDKIEIGSTSIIDSDGKLRWVSFIEITLKR